MLQEHGLTVIESGSAEDAFAALSSMRIDVLVTDVNLPGLSGPRLALRARGVSAGVGVVFATGDNAVDRPVAGAVVLTKPYNNDEALGQAICEAAGYVPMIAGDATPARSARRNHSQNAGGRERDAEHRAIFGPIAAPAYPGARCIFGDEGLTEIVWRQVCPTRRL